MIGTTRNLRVFAYTEPADLRKGFDGLYGMVTGELGRDPLSGECYLFVNRRRTRAKVLVWDGTGLCIFQKRLEQGRFASLWDRKRRHQALELTTGELNLFLEGSELVGTRKLVPAAYVPKAIENTGTF